MKNENRNTEKKIDTNLKLREKLDGCGEKEVIEYIEKENICPFRGACPSYILNAFNVDMNDTEIIKDCINECINECIKQFFLENQTNKVYAFCIHDCKVLSENNIFIKQGEKLLVRSIDINDMAIEFTTHKYGKDVEFNGCYFIFENGHEERLNVRDKLFPFRGYDVKINLF